MEEKYKLLLVDDEPDILEVLSFNFRNDGYEVFTASDGESGIQVALREIPHLVLLDMMMPGIDGVETCEIIRSHCQLDSTIVAMLSARDEDYSQIAGFNAGADDYIAKPIGLKVLKARIAALLKRKRLVTKEITDANDDCKSNDMLITLDKETYTVIKNGKNINLPRKEFELLALLMSKPEKLFDRDEIFMAIWGSNVVVGCRTIDVHIRKLREKIGSKHILTMRGVGYKFVSNP